MISIKQVNAPAALMGMVLVALAMGHVGCAQSVPDDLSSGQLQGGLLGFEQEEPPWASWTVEAPDSPTLAEPLAPATVFDAWRIDDPAFIDPLWDTLFHLLLGAQVEGGDAEQNQVFQYLQYHLDPDWQDVSVEVAFVSHGDGEAEGIVLRWVNAAGAGLWIEGYRRAQGAVEPVGWRLIAEPAVAERRPVELVWSVDEQGRWKPPVVDGGTESPAQARDWAPWLRLLTQNLWEPLSGRNYLEPDIEFRRQDVSALGPGWPAALGKAIEDRQIADYVDDTQFVPATEF